MSDKEKNTANESIMNYGQPANLDEVWKLFKETDKMFKETDQKMQETDRKMQETDKKMQETDRKIDKLAKLYGGVSENSRDVAEEFFRRGLETRDLLFGISYGQVGKLEKRSKKLQGEYDIVLYNGDKMVVIEVKYKLHPSDITDFVKRKLPNFKPLFPEYADKKIIGGVAGMSVPAASSELAQKHGLLVLTQSGENLTVLNKEGFVLKEV